MLIFSASCNSHVTKVAMVKVADPVAFVRYLTQLHALKLHLDSGQSRTNTQRKSAVQTTLGQVAHRLRVQA